MSSLTVSPAQAVPAAPSHQQRAAPQRFGPSHANHLAVDGKAQPVTFAVGAAGDHFASVRVVIKDETGTTVASFALAALSGTQNIIWTPRTGAAAGGYSAYWEGSLAQDEA